MSDSTNKNKALMRRIYEEMWDKGKPALAVEIFEQPAGVERFVSQFLLSFPDLHHTVEEMIAEGDGGGCEILGIRDTYSSVAGIRTHGQIHPLHWHHVGAYCRGEGQRTPHRVG